MVCPLYFNREYWGLSPIFEREIGVYEKMLDPTQARILNEQINEQRLTQLPDHTERVVSGERFRRLRVRFDNGVVEKIVGTREPIDPQLSEVLQGLGDAVKTVLEHPRKTLRMRMHETGVSGAGSFKIEVTLSSTGKEQVVVLDPARLTEASDGWFHFKMWPVKPLAELEPEEIFTLKPSSLEWVKSPAELREDGTFQLEQGEDVTFSATVLLPIATPLMVRAEYACYGVGARRRSSRRTHG